MKIRPAIPDDAPSIARVHIASWRAAYAGIVPHAHLDALDEGQFAERWRNWITTETSASICVAEVDGNLCGFASAGPIRRPVSSYDGELYAIYLLPRMQRRGIGRALFAYMAAELAARWTEPHAAVEPPGQSINRLLPAPRRRHRSRRRPGDRRRTSAQNRVRMVRHRNPNLDIMRSLVKGSPLISSKQTPSEAA